MPELAPCLRLPLLLVAGGLWLTGCSTPGPQPAIGPSPSTSLVWPAPPDAPRIAWVQNITRPADLGIKRSTFGRMANWVTGSEKGNEQLLRPFGVSVDEKDDLCVTDTAANAVWLFDLKAKK